MSKKAIITVGISASGKSTWAVSHISKMADRGERWIHTERDWIRRTILFEKSGGSTQELVWS